MLTAVSQQRSDHMQPLGIVIMGVSGCGKTTIARSLARSLRVKFLDADKFHPQVNIEKMSSGTALTDADREPWLDDVGSRIAGAAKDRGMVVAACSALRRTYRERLNRASNLNLLFVLLDGSREVLQHRVNRRTSHFMPATLLDSQLATLERPDDDERAMAVSISKPVKKIVSEIMQSPQITVIQRRMADTTSD
ncbi:gluconokinase [Pelagibius sp. Alg239-R121]|uniref:gluconokinase n=1 Tax=Pelagibius sp. Alg239-R121 TaxID=2993448 RepID=UPI0024A657C1|nr:gluconokinase [Pelagibius sp. Alg239-R121]